MKKFLAVLFSVVILATFMAVPAFAVDSPEGGVIHTVKLPDGDTVAVPDGETIKITVSDGEKEFESWVITGEYEIVSGSLTSDEIEILPKSDLVVTEKYKDAVIEGDKDENESDKAPQTGNDVIMMVTLLTAGAFVAMVATRKAVRS